MWLDYKTVKKLATMEGLLAHYNVKLKVYGDSLRGKCPLPTHSSPTSTESFSASRSKNIWSCKSESCIHNSGRKGGNVLDFVMVMENCPLPAAAQKIVEWFGSSQPLQTPPEKEKAPAHMEKGPDVPKEDIPRNTVNPTAPDTGVKPVPYFQQVETWLNGLLTRGDQEEEEDYKARVKKGVKAKLIESYRNGKLAAQNLAPKAA